MPSKISVLFDAERILEPIRDEQTARAIGAKVGKDITGGASADFGATGDINGKIHGAILNALFERQCAGITQEGDIVCEYYLGTETHCVLYSPLSGEIFASIFTRDGKMRPYIIRDLDKNGEALFAALMAYSVYKQKNSEFLTMRTAFLNERERDFPNPEEAEKLAARICENITKRIQKASTCGNAALHISNLDDDFNVQPIKKSKIQTAKIEETYSEKMSFQYFGISTSGRYLAIKTAEQLQDAYAMPRILTTEEMDLIPSDIQTGYEIPEDVPMLCEHIVKSTDFGIPMRNFLLRGGSGVGKTSMARAVAYGLRLPYVFYTCSTSDEIYNFLGQILPAVQDKKTGETVSFSAVMVSGNFDRFLLDNGLPTYTDLEFDTGVAYQKLTGTYKAEATENECILLLAQKLLSMIGSTQTAEGQRFGYVETDFVRAIRNGWVVEIQECGVILQPGVLVGLNGLLDQTAKVRLMTGELVTRHPDTVVILTTNVSYAGCRPLNQSLLSRMDLIVDLPKLTPEQLKARAIKKTGFVDEETLDLMVNTIQRTQEYCQNNGIDDGVCELRELISWIQSYQITQDMERSAEVTILSHAAADDDTRKEIKEACFSIFMAA